MLDEDRYADKSVSKRRGVVRYLAGGIVLAAVLVFAVAAALIALWPDSDETPLPAPAPTQTPVLSPLGIAEVEYPTPLPTRPPQQPAPTVDWVRPTAAPQEIAAALDIPVASTASDGVIERDLDPLTIIPLRSRSEVVTYHVKSGDNLRDIASRFGISENTIIWSNNRFYVNAMRVGLELTILPVDGAYHRVQDAESIASIAETYAVDPYAIIDSEYNGLFGSSPQTVLPPGMAVVVPGGTGSTEPIYWDPGIVMTSGSDSEAVGTGVNAGTSYASFAIGDPGSCGEQPVAGGSAPFGAPIWRNYTITQDYSWNHGGIDLAVPEGTPVYAAGGGTVIFRGWSTWGYGYTVVIAHGGTLSIYGHLNGAFVGCGEVVERGQNIAVTGNSGRSSGPHLHFEIRNSGGVPDNPWNYQSF